MSMIKIKKRGKKINIIDAAKQVITEKRTIRSTSDGVFSVISISICYELVAASADGKKTERRPYRDDDVRADDRIFEN